MSSLRVSIGERNLDELPAPPRKEYLAQISRGSAPEAGAAPMAPGGIVENKASQRTQRSSRRGSDIWKPIWFGKTAAKVLVAGYRDHGNFIFAEWLDTLWSSWPQIRPRGESTTTLRRKTDLISRTGRA